MFKPKTTIAGRLENSSGGAISSLDGIQTQIKKTPFPRSMRPRMVFVSGKVPSFKVAGVRYHPSMGFKRR